MRVLGQKKTTGNSTVPIHLKNWIFEFKNNFNKEFTKTATRCGALG